MSAFDFDVDFESDFDVEEFGLIGQSLITDASGNRQFEDSVLIYNENFGQDLDTTKEWGETVNAGTKSITNGVLKLNGTLMTGQYIEERNKSFTVTVDSKTKKFRAKFKVFYTAQSHNSYFGFEAVSGNYKIIFLKDDSGANDNWSGYILGEDLTEYSTADFSVTRQAWHTFEIIWNFERADFYVDGVKKGSIVGQTSTVDTNLYLACRGPEVNLQFDYIRVWEINVPK